MNGDDEESPQQKKPGIFLYFLYASILVLLILLISQAFFSGVSEVTVNTIVTQNVEESLSCECKIFFDDKGIQIKTEKFTLQRYASKEFSHKMNAKKQKKIVVFGECCCEGENRYNQSKLFLVELASNKISIDFAFLKTNTSMYNIYG